MGTDSLASGFWVAFRIEPPGPLWLVHKGVGPCMGAQRKRSAVVARGQPTAPFCALPNGSLNKAGLTCHRSPTAGVVDLSNGSTQGVPACHRAGAPPKACGRRSARFSSFDRCRCSVEVPALSCASPTRMPLRGQREGACGGAWLARGRDLRRGNRGLLSAGSGGPVVAVFPVCFFLSRIFASTIHCYVWGCQAGFSKQGSGDRVNCERGTFTPA